MRIRSVLAAAGISGCLLLVAGALPAGAAPPLKWNDTDQITSGVPVPVSSITPCPTVPTPGDTVLVQITVSFRGGGGMGTVLTANSDGSWSGSVTFDFTNAPVRGVISAECLDFDGHTGTAYAHYQAGKVALTSS